MIVQEVTLPRFVAVSLIAAVLCIAPAAHASPPDETWIAGFYDNADFDDVVLLITSNCGAIPFAIVGSLRLLASVVDVVTPIDTALHPLDSLSSAFSRGPPLAYCFARNLNRCFPLLIAMTSFALPSSFTAWPPGVVLALAIDPVTPTTLYVNTNAKVRTIPPKPPVRTESPSHISP